MNYKLIFVIVFIILVLIFYIIGVFGERKVKILKKKYVIIFWFGFIFDILGIFIMSNIVNSYIFEVKFVLL